MSDGVITIQECKLYECYYARIQDSKYCMYHQPIREEIKA